MSDLGSESDDHHRLVKGALIDTYPNVSATVTTSATAFNHLSGIGENIQAALDTYSLSLSAVNTSVDAVSARNR